MKNIHSSSFAKLFTIFALLNAILRVIFLVWEQKEIEFSLFLLIKIFSVGLFFDFITLCYFSSIAVIYYNLTPTRVFNDKIHRNFHKIIYFSFLYLVIFGFFAEIIFWQEFQTRFNFIAVDYLIYTTEVIKNIVESYPIFWFLLLIAVVAAMIFYFTYKKIIITKKGSFANNLKQGSVIPLVALLAFFTIDSAKPTRISDNNFANEIASNGVYHLFSAYRNNKINYLQLYQTIDSKQAMQKVRADIAAQEPQSKFLQDYGIERMIPKIHGVSEKRYNVILVSIESLSAEFMQYFGNTANITPNLDKIAQNGIFFTGLKATGTRTVRGLEALTLSVPPTPGNSIVRRPNNENLFNISTPFKDRGYDIRFLYGGNGYFDNMNYFYENNNFEIVDRGSFADEEITFENAWGVSDENLYSKALQKADQSYKSGKPFFHFIMTTSNHRPYTYPDGAIDIPSKTNRDGAVKYSDYAIAKLLEEAQKKPWFNNTIFVFVADHCAGSAGNTDVPLWRYQIPAIFYAPKIIKPQIYTKNVSQIDIAPTLMGLLNFSYKSKFFGSDVIRNDKTIAQRSFVSTYLDVGYYKNNRLFLLKPKKEVRVFDVVLHKYGWDGSSEKIIKSYKKDELESAMSYYQVANELFENNEMKNDAKN